ncbi:hypothetical protein CR513_50551, partial [Mucuna pruriens]
MMLRDNREIERGEEHSSEEVPYKEMEITFVRAQIFKSHEAKMARFLNCLNRDIQDIDKERREEKLLRREKTPNKGNALAKGYKEEVSKVKYPNTDIHKSSNIKCFKC